MNDLENELRDLLASRATAAAGAGPANLLAGVRHRVRRRVIKRRAEVAVLGAFAVLAAGVLPLTIQPGHQPTPPATGLRSLLPLTDVAATPEGWVPIPEGDAQISVPKSWDLYSCSGRVSGAVFASQGALSKSARHSEASCRHTPNLVTFSVSADQPSSHAPVIKVNGIGVQQVAGPSGFTSYLAPALHVRLSVRGPVGDRVLSTLTRSPLSVVRAAGKPTAVPAGWRWHEFAGVRFAAPASWPLDDHGGAPCQYGVTSDTVIATRDRALVYNCPAEFLVAGTFVPKLGVEILAGPANPGYYDKDVTGCLRRHGLSICTSPTASSGAVLYLVVRRPGIAKATDVLIGLAGTGAIARTIYHSIGPVRGSD